ncbi:MAG TPA: DUF6496 domain-containing protein [Acetobacteraceae bacterium]|jgi:hypothetical protein|nr:DUF6496 domain-containing protein [Acetobacteraceae bacterium]
MAKESKAQQETVARVMHEFKHGELKSGSGRKVRNPRQAIAIGLSEAGATNRKSPKQNRQALARTKRRERKGEAAAAQERGPTRAELYREATERGIKGRSRMSKAELEGALHR